MLHLPKDGDLQEQGKTDFFLISQQGQLQTCVEKESEIVLLCIIRAYRVFADVKWLNLFMILVALQIANLAG